MNKDNSIDQPIWIAKELVAYYMNPTEPTKYPHLFVEMVRRDRHDRIVAKKEAELEYISKRYDALVIECNKLKENLIVAPMPPAEAANLEERIKKSEWPPLTTGDHGVKPHCPKCGGTELAVERRPNGDAFCNAADCKWKGPYVQCWPDPGSLMTDSTESL